MKFTTEKAFAEHIASYKAKLLLIWMEIVAMKETDEPDREDVWGALLHECGFFTSTMWRDAHINRNMGKIVVSRGMGTEPIYDIYFYLNDPLSMTVEKRSVKGRRIP